MDRRLVDTDDRVRFRVDASRCDGQGVCVLVAPELFALDRYGYAYVVPDAGQRLAQDPDLRARGLEADATCPRDAISEQHLAVVTRGPDPAPAPPADRETPGAASRLLVAEQESVGAWRARGGWASDPGDVLGIVERAGVIGHGGAGFPTAAKWRRVAGAASAVVVANGAEREPGTVKDRTLLVRRPGLVLDGLRLAARAVGADRVCIAVDEDADDAYAAVAEAAGEAGRLGLLDGLELSLHRVPTSYVAGEETALLNVLGGGLPVPRMRPPYPSTAGLGGRPTLVQNVETLAQVALAVHLGEAGFRAVGTSAAPGSGLFSVGRFAGSPVLVERPYGHILADLLCETDLDHDVAAVLVGGYAGGLLRPDQLDLPLTPAALTDAGAAMGTKSIQVVGSDRCPVGVVAGIVAYFGAETADQCPPCFRGLPDMTAFLRGLEDGTGGPAAVEELDRFTGTLFDRGICRLPDGAARVTQSLLRGFSELVAAHAEAGCPSVRTAAASGSSVPGPG